MAEETTEEAAMGASVQESMTVESVSVGSMTVGTVTVESLSATRSGAGLSIANASLPSSVTAGESYNVTATLSNDGNERQVEQVQYQIAGNVIASELVEVAPGNQSEVTFEINTSEVGFPAGTYEHGVYAFSASETGELTIEEAGTQTEEAETTEEGEETAEAEETETEAEA